VDPSVRPHRTPRTVRPDKHHTQEHGYVFLRVQYNRTRTSAGSDLRTLRDIALGGINISLSILSNRSSASHGDPLAVA
jgi:hypothetical protein